MFYLLYIHKLGFFGNLINFISDYGSGKMVKFGISFTAAYSIKASILKNKLPAYQLQPNSIRCPVQYRYTFGRLKFPLISIIFLKEESIDVKKQ